MDFDKLLAPVDDDAPCGENLEYDPEFGELNRAAAGREEQVMGDEVKPAEPPDWREVRKLSEALFGRTKDLRVAALLTQANLQLDGLTGMRDGVALVQRLLTENWDEVHPQLDAEDDDDPTERINSLDLLVDETTLLRQIREAPLVTSKVLGTFSARDIDVASGSLPPKEGQEPPPYEQIEAAFLDCELEDLQASADAGREAVEALQAVEDFLTDKLGTDNTLDFSALQQALKDIGRIYSEQLARRGVDDGEAGEAVGEGGTPVRAVSGDITSREDAIRMLDKISEFFRRSEPSSPVPLLLQRAKGLIAKDFMEILEDLTPNGLDQARMFKGSDD